MAGDARARQDGRVIERRRQPRAGGMATVTVVTGNDMIGRLTGVLAAVVTRDAGP